MEAIGKLTDAKNIKLFAEQGIFTEEEVKARQAVLLEHYTGIVETEALAMIQIMEQNVIPSTEEASALMKSVSDPRLDVSKLRGAVKGLQQALDDIHAQPDHMEAARKARVLRLETMVATRELCDLAEAACPAHLWSLPTYAEMLFDSEWLDQH